MAENTQKPTASNKYSLYSGREEAVNWGQVAVDLTKGLEGIRDSRAAAKQKIIDDTNAAMDKLSEIADLQAPSMNSLIIDGSDFSKNTLQANMDLVKRGLLDPKDYMLIMQQQKDGYKALSNYAKNYDAKYKEGIERIKNGEASNLEEFFRGTGFSFGNTKNKKLWSDPATGQLLLVEMEPDPDNEGQFRLPSREKNPGAYTTPASMLNLINFQENSRDLNEDVANLVTNNLAEVVTSTITSYSVLSGGKDVKSIEDFRQLFDDVEGEGFTDEQGNKMTFDDWLESQAKGVVSDSNAAAEYLLNAGLGFSFTDDPDVAKKDSKKILVNTGEGQMPTVTLTDEQEAEAIRLAKNQINSQLDSVVKVNAGLGGQQERAQTTGEINQDTLDKNINGYLADLNVVLTDPDIKSSEGRLNKLIQQRNEQNIANGNPVITNVDITDDIILVEFDGREPIRIVRTEYDEKDGVAAQTTLQEDIASLYDVLSPFGDKEGYDLSATEVTQRVNDNIELGDRGKQRQVGFEEAVELASTDNTSAKVFEIDGKEETIAEYLKVSGGMDETTAGNTNNEIQRVLTQTINRFLSAADKQAFGDAGFTGLKIDVSGSGKSNRITLIYNKPVPDPDNPGEMIMEEVKVDVGGAKRNTTMEQLADSVAQAMNIVNEDANKNREGGGQTFMTTYPEWKKKNPNKTYLDYKKEMGL
tara:strand:+ start:123 stop:2216 length:2094 start_codon:yes stop_codon:yes gene_type:complete